MKVTVETAYSRNEIEVTGKTKADLLDPLSDDHDKTLLQLCFGTRWGLWWVADCDGSDTHRSGIARRIDNSEDAQFIIEW